MRVLITGGAGFVGSHLVEKLVGLGHDVDVLDDLSNGSMDNVRNLMAKITFAERDVVEPFRDMYQDRKLDAIYHLACYPRSRSFENPKRDVEVNVIGMVNVLELARQKKARVIFSSNSGIYDTSKIPINEKTSDSPKTPYDLDKLQAESYMKLYGTVYGVEYVIFRFATVYGPRQRVTAEWKPVIMEFISKLRKGEAPTVYWDGEQTRDFIYVEDIVNALAAALDNKRALGETMILGSGKETSINTLYKSVSDLLGVNIQPTRLPKQLGDIQRMRYDCRKATKLLGWKANVSLQDGIKRVTESFS
jgi:UDP-glucose 4-epimerase